VADKLTDEEEKRFIIEDNVPFGEWDFDILANEWERELLEEWGVTTYWDGVEQNNMNDDDVDLTEDFDPIGISKDCQRVVFIFDNSESAEKYLNDNKIKFEKRSMAWQVNMNILFT
jgi:hypothetical protein